MTAGTLEPLLVLDQTLSLEDLVNAAKRRVQDAALHASSAQVEFIYYGGSKSKVDRTEGELTKAREDLLEIFNAAVTGGLQLEWKLL